MRILIFFLLAGAFLQSAQAAAPGADELPAIAIIGTGSVGSALGVSWGGLGHPIIYGSREPESAATQELVSRSGASLSPTWRSETLDFNSDQL